MADELDPGLLPGPCVYYIGIYTYTRLLTLSPPFDRVHSQQERCVC